MEKIARQIEAVIRTVPGTTSAYAERVIGGYYLNIDPDRTQLARYGLPMIGGMVSSTLLTLIVIPAIYAVVKGIAIRLPRLAPPLQQT
jgi:copper/silver efflux system protein